MVFFVEKITGRRLEFLSEDGQERIFELALDALPSEFVDVRNGCPPEHQEAFDAARAARAILVHG